MPVVRVERLDDPRLDDYRSLRERDLRRIDEGLFVGEQLLVVERMLAVPGAVRSVLVGAPFLARVEALVPQEIPVYLAPMTLLEALAGFPVHRGVLAIGRRAALERHSLDDLAGPAEEARTLLACEDITHLDNIGLLFRNAAAFAAHGVLLSPRCHDPLYRKCLRVSIGHALTVPWRRAQAWPEELEALRRAGYEVLGASLDPDAIALDEIAPPRRGVLVVGTEFAGLAPATAAACDRLVRIPMAVGVDSLNVAVAAGVCLHRLSVGRRT